MKEKVGGHLLAVIQVSSTQLPKSHPPTAPPTSTAHRDDETNLKQKSTWRSRWGF